MDKRMDERMGDRTGERMGERAGDQTGEHRKLIAAKAQGWLIRITALCEPGALRKKV
jgi:hypothetical protein